MVKKKRKPKKKSEIFEKNPGLKEFIKRISGNQGIVVISNLWGKELTDEELAKLTDLKINLVRRILYDLYENRIVNYRRSRNESNGWYVYHWHVEIENAMENFQSIQAELLRKLEERLEYERNHMFFGCKHGCPKITFEEATELEFKCPHCGEALEFMNNEGVVSSLESQIKSLKENWGERLQVNP